MGVLGVINYEFKFSGDHRAKALTLTLKPYGVTTAAKLMGHSNPMMTLKIYTQVKDDEAHLAGISIKEFINKAS